MLNYNYQISSLGAQLVNYRIRYGIINSTTILKIKDCVKQVPNSVYNIQKKNFTKNRLSCNRCEFFKTEHCP